MFGAIKTCSRGNQPFRQMFTATQAARALRPFYFAVHPDLFGSHPEIRSINEESLKVLNGYLDGLFCAPLRLPQPVTLTFFVRPSKIAATASTTSCASFRRVQLQLNTGDACDAVRRVLEEFQLSTEDLQPSRNQRHSGNNSSVHPVDWQFFYKMYRSNLDPFNSAYQQQHQQMWQSFGRTKKKPTPKPTSLTEALSQYAKDSATLTRREAAIKVANRRCVAN